MFWWRSILALCLALILIVAPFSAGWADSVSPTDITDGSPVDAGHPWDDEATEAEDPDPDEGSLRTVRPRDDWNQSDLSPAVVTTSGTRWLGSAVVYFWQRAVSSQFIAKVRTISFWR